MAAVSSDGYLSFWHPATGKCIFSMRDPNSADLFCVDYRQDGALIAVGNKDSKIHVVDEATKSIITTLESKGTSSTLGHSNRIFSTKFTNDPNILVSGGWDSTVYFWDIRLSKSIGFVIGPNICSDSIDIQGDSMLTGSNNNKNVLQLWSVSTMKLIENIPWSPEALTSEELGFLYTVNFDRKGKYIVAGGAGLNEFRVFTNKPGHELVSKVTLPKIVSSSHFAHNKDLVVLGCTDGNARVLTFEEKV